MFTAEELEDLDICPKRITYKGVLTCLAYSTFIIFACVLMYTFYSGRDLSSVIYFDNVKYNTDNYMSVQMYEIDSEFNYDLKDKYYINLTEYNQNKFIKENVRKSIPAIFRDSIKEWSAYKNWNNTDYMVNKLETYFNKKTITIEKQDYGLIEGAFKIFSDNLTYIDYLNQVYYDKIDLNLFIRDISIPDTLISDVKFEIFPLDKILNLIDISYSEGYKQMNEMGHTDIFEKIWCQITGTIDIVLIPALYKNTVYPHKAKYGKTDYSPVNFFKAEYGKYPNFRNSNRLYISLSEGDCIYIPSFWWYATRSIDNSHFIRVIAKYQTNSRLAGIILKGLELSFPEIPN